MLSNLKRAYSGMNTKLNVIYEEHGNVRELLWKCVHCSNRVSQQNTNTVITALLITRTIYFSPKFYRNVFIIFPISGFCKLRRLFILIFIFTFLLFMPIFLRYYNISAMKHLNNTFIKYMFLQYLGKYDIHNCMFI